jgi:beta-lactamase regulating signal transducer with metallopeptidase domain
MNNWTEFHIGIIYFAGLLVALITSVLIVLYLRPIRTTLKKITGKFDTLWNHSFKTTVMLVGLLGAMSVTFKDCNGNYDDLLESKQETVMKGLEQVSTSFDSLTIILGLWLVIFIIFRLTLNNKNKIPST